MPAAPISITDLSFSYPAPLPDQEPVPALRHINLEIERGQFVALIGPIGAGKTTLCQAMNGLVPQVSDGIFAGKVQIEGLDTNDQPAAEIAHQVGMVFEDAEVQLFNASAEDEIAFALEELGWAPADIEERIDWALEKVGLTGFRHRSPRTLSGGEQKRLAVATVLAVAPPILVLDEPTAGLDPRGKREVMDVIDGLAEEKQSTVVMASQNPEIVARYADRVILLKEGEICFDGTPLELYGRLGVEPDLCVGMPQLAELGHLLAPSFPDLPRFLDIEGAHRAISALFDADGGVS